MLTPSKAGVGVVGDVDPGQQREGTVVELHRRALRRLDGLGDLQQTQLDRRLGPEHRAAGDAEQQGVADLSGGAGHGYADRLGSIAAHAFISSMTASANWDVPTAVGSSRCGFMS